jgi:uncharacterized membrane protein
MATIAKHRIESIDILRGLVMLIMAIDHVRDIFHPMPEPTDLAVTTPFLFFTRLITHYCAPTFVFLSGISAHLAGTRRTVNELSAFLIQRGLWLIVAELSFITFALTLNPLFNVFVFQVIWAIGGSMVLLGLLIWLRASLPVIAVIGATIFLGHNILDIVDPGAIGKTISWKVLLTAAGFNSLIDLGGNRFLLMAYALLPWTAVMLLGYVFGSLYKSTYNAAKRKKILIYSGLGLLALFLTLRYFNIYGDPAPWSVQKNMIFTLISFVNTTKYPCSLLYLSMTLGVSLIILAYLEGIKNKLASIILVYGNVPFFYYICHWYLIQVIHIVAFFVLGYKTSQIVTPNFPFLFSPPGFQYSLVVVYGVWLLVIVILYFPCRWFATYKKTHSQWWLSYI